MTKPRAPIEIPLGVGIDTKTDPKQVQPGRNLVVENGELTRTGALRKRKGYDFTGTKTAGDYATYFPKLPRLDGLADRDGEAVAMDGAVLWSKRQDGFVARGMCCTARAEITPHARPDDWGNGTQYYQHKTMECDTFGILVANGVAGFAQVDVYAYDLETKEILWETTKSGGSGGSYNPHLVRLGPETLGLVIQHNGAMYLHYWSRGSSTSTNAQLISSDVRTTSGGGKNYYDVYRRPDNGNLVIAYATETSNDWTLAEVTTGGGSVASATLGAVSGTVTASPVILARPGGDYYVPIAENGAFTIYSVDQALTTPSSLASTGSVNWSTPRQMQALLQEDVANTTEDGIHILLEDAGGLYYHFYDLDASSGTEQEVIYEHTDGSSVAEVRIKSRMFWMRGHPHCFVAYMGDDPDVEQNTLYLASIARTALHGCQIWPVGRFLYAEIEYDIHANNHGAWAYVHQDGDRVRFHIPKRSTFSTATSDGAHQVYELSLDWSLPPQVELVHGALYVTGAQVTLFDGERCTLAGFQMYPIGMADGSKSAGGLPDGTYGFTMCYEWEDATGRTWLSAPAPPNSVTLSSSNGSFSNTIPQLPWDTKGDKVILRQYRTLVNGSVYYKYAESTQVTRPSAATTTDGAHDTDANVGANALLYTGGGVAENIPPEFPVHITSRARRLWILSSRRRLWVTKELDDVNGARFSDVAGLREVLAYQSGRPAFVVAVAGELLLGFEDEIVRFYGDGPNDVGVTNLSGPYDLPNEFGGKVGALALRYGGGALVQTNRGIYAIRAGGQMQYLGAEVEGLGLTAAYKGAAHATQERVFLGHRGAEQFTELNTLREEWTTHALPAALRDHAMVGGRHYIALGDGRILRARDDYDSDSLVVETPWIKTAGAQGAQRIGIVYLLGAWKSPHRLKWSAYVDYGDTPEQIITVDVSTEVSPYQFRMKPKIQWCAAMKFRIEVEPTGDGEGAELSTIRVEYSPETRARVPAARSV